MPLALLYAMYPYNHVNFGNVIQEGRTPLHIAASNNFIKTIEMLVNAGATVDIPDKVRVIIFVYTCVYKISSYYTKYKS